MRRDASANGAVGGITVSRLIVRRWTQKTASVYQLRALLRCSLCLRMRPYVTRLLTVPPSCCPVSHTLVTSNLLSASLPHRVLWWPLSGRWTKLLFHEADPTTIIDQQAADGNKLIPARPHIRCLPDCHSSFWRLTTATRRISCRLMSPSIFPHHPTGVPP